MRHWLSLHGLTVRYFSIKIELPAMQADTFRFQQALSPNMVKEADIWLPEQFHNLRNVQQYVSRRQEK